ncbi:hypothetical protein Pfo_018924 [Paulownia fortunei]|nr:hypothetical protein Pfo_018924 [Paulownia fortunei]
MLSLAPTRQEGSNVDCGAAEEWKMLEYFLEARSKAPFNNERVIEFVADEIRGWALLFKWVHNISHSSRHCVEHLLWLDLQSISKTGRGVTPTSRSSLTLIMGPSSPINIIYILHAAQAHGSSYSVVMTLMGTISITA